MKINILDFKYIDKNQLNQLFVNQQSAGLRVRAQVS